MRTPSPRRRPRQRLGFLAFAFVSQLAPLHGEPENPPHHTADLHSQATARMDRWFEPDDHAAKLLRYELSAIFRDWGRRDLPGAEAFIRGLRWTPCDSNDPDDMRVALHYATLIGASPADPALAWRKLISHEKARDQFIINPGNIPYSHQIAARFLFQAYHHADPKGAVASLHHPQHGVAPREVGQIQFRLLFRLNVRRSPSLDDGSTAPAAFHRRALQNHGRHPPHRRSPPRLQSPPL